MRKYLLPEKGQFYKASMHVYTNISDGRLSPEEVKNAYKNLGYSIIAYTDHEVFVPHNDLTDDDFLAINAVEISINDPSTEEGGWNFMRTCHINLYAKNKNTDYSSVCTEESIYVEHSHKYMTERMKQNKFRKEYSPQAINMLTKAAKSEGFLVCFNHPIGSWQNYEDYIKIKNLWAIEWYNAGSNTCGVMETMQACEDLLRIGERVYPIAGDDSHYYDLIGKCFTMIKAEKLEYASVISSLEKGDFYSSTGPEINELYLDGEKLHISCSASEKIFVTTERRVCFTKISDGSPVTEAEFDLENYIKESHLNDESYERAYIRVTVIDSKGNEAHTRAYFLTDIIE